MRKGRHLSFKVLGGPLACVSTSLGRLEWPAWCGGGGEERGRTDSMSLQWVMLRKNCSVRWSLDLPLTPFSRCKLCLHPEVYITGASVWVERAAVAFSLFIFYEFLAPGLIQFHFLGYIFWACSHLQAVSGFLLLPGSVWSHPWQTLSHSHPGLWPSVLSAACLSVFSVILILSPGLAFFFKWIFASILNRSFLSSIS